ncbi:hypothetical protein ACFYUK_33640 [Nonomuraea wenchangensis]
MRGRRDSVVLAVCCRLPEQPDADGEVAVLPAIRRSPFLPRLAVA